MFSLSHVVGDGRTYYGIFQMLQPGAAVRALTSVRYSEMIRDSCGLKAGRQQRRRVPVHVIASCSPR